MLVTADQIRAARALIDWNQDDLAKATGLARPTIVNIESGNQKPGRTTLEKIINALNENGIEFTAGEGVRKKAQTVRIYRGAREGFEFFDFVLQHMQEKQGSLYINNIDSHEYERCYPGFYESRYFQDLGKLAGTIDVRRLICFWNYDHPHAKYGEWRWQNDEGNSASIPFYVFGNYFGIILFLDEPIVFLIEDAECAEIYREKFLLQWDSAMEKPSISQRNT